MKLDLIFGFTILFIGIHVVDSRKIACAYGSDCTQECDKFSQPLLTSCGKCQCIPDYCTNKPCIRYCRNGVKFDQFGCPKCECLLIFRACKNRKCDKNCPFGYARDKRNCQLCKCLPLICPSYACFFTSECPFERAKDARGCSTCECAPASPSIINGFENQTITSETLFSPPNEIKTDSVSNVVLPDIFPSVTSTTNITNLFNSEAINVTDLPTVKLYNSPLFSDVNFTTSPNRETISTIPIINSSVNNINDAGFANATLNVSNNASVLPPISTLNINTNSSALLPTNDTVSILPTFATGISDNLDSSFTFSLEPDDMKILGDSKMDGLNLSSTSNASLFNTTDFLPPNISNNSTLNISLLSDLPLMIFTTAIANNFSSNFISNSTVPFFQ